MAVPIILPGENPEDIYARLIGDLPAPVSSSTPWNTRAGSLIHTILQPVALEVARLQSVLPDIMGQGFLQYATGSALDDKAAEVGVYRKPALPAFATLTITGDVGTVIPTGARFSTIGASSLDSPGIEFVYLGLPVSIDGSGTIDIPVRAADVGAQGNVEADSITIFEDSIPGATAVTNDVAASNGEDAQTDEQLRTQALIRASALPATGNAATYLSLAVQRSGISTARIEDLWQGNGTARLVLSGSNTIFVTPDVIDEMQEFLDPSVKHLCHFEGETWTGTVDTQETASPIAGQASMRLTASAADATDTVSRVVDYNLSFWNAGTDELWLFVERESNASTIDDLTIRIGTGGTPASNYADFVISGATIDALGSSTGRGWIQVARSSAANTGTPDWSNVTLISLILDSATGQSGIILVDELMIVRGAGGHGTGMAPVGIQVTVSSAATSQINISADLTLQPNTILTDIEDGLRDALREYLRTFSVEDNVLRVTSIANVIHDFPGVLDYANVQIARVGTSLAASNITLEPGERPSAGTITLT